ncbi:hypothetical protein ALC57_12588 [Trachymyrmex cornetzi]|uniref:Uncharacterized protein n=1 Tax=Trachymyrmex cornetzi TaxID=471704 RepID=A0A151J170_9HYME|nr:hypothetical protein ALC57_12588 [Trachymyrmex cornetzi]
MALLCSYTCIPYYPLLDYSGYDRVCERVEACIGLPNKALGRFLLGFGSSSSPEKIVSVMIGSLEESAVFSTTCFSGSTIVAVLRGGTILIHYIFSHPMPWHFLTRFDKSCTSWLSTYHHGLRWDDGMVPYSTVRRLITEAVLEGDVVYVNEHEKRGWLADMLDTDDIIVETLDAHYKDVESLRNLDDCNTIRCGKHANCALQNVFKIFNWWSRHQEKL